MATAAPARSSPWLHGPVSDTVLGGGLLYVPIFLVLLVGGSWAHDATPFFLMPLLVLFFSNPHLGATLLRVYERPEDRRAYRLFALWATLLIGVSFYVGLRVPIVGSVLITFYLTVVPWHFTGQNYGIALVFLRRRGVEIDAALKRTIYLAFVLPFVLWILALHGERAGPSDYAPLGTQGTIYAFHSLGIPAVVQGSAALLAAVAYLYVLGDCALRLRGRAPLRDLLPSVAVASTQALWFAVPIFAAFFLQPSELGLFSPAAAAFTFGWISVLHAVQYLWITTYYARREQHTGAPRFLGKALLAGTALYGLPLLLLAHSDLTRLPYDTGLYLMLAGALNVHHVMLDGVIWKLRNARIARILIRGEDENGAAPVRARRPWLKGLVWASGAVGVALTLAGTFEGEQLRRASDRDDLTGIERTARRLAWLGRDASGVRLDLGYRKASRGDRDGAIREFERSLALWPNAGAWMNIGALRERDGEFGAALAAYDEALALDPDDPTALHYAGRAAIKAGELVRARELLERAVSLAPDRPEIRDTLEAARQRSAARQHGAG